MCVWRQWTTVHLLFNLLDTCNLLALQSLCLLYSSHHWSVSGQTTQKTGYFWLEDYSRLNRDTEVYKNSSSSAVCGAVCPEHTHTQTPLPALKHHLFAGEQSKGANKWSQKPNLLLHTTMWTINVDDQFWRADVQHRSVNSLHTWFNSPVKCQV